MAVFKCKMCGGALEVSEGMTVCECEYCGTQQTLPRNHDEVLTNLFNRANNLRTKSEFDKAQEIYEKIVSQNPTEAEAYWGIILCKFGIEYVEDPATLRKIPTCHRTQLESVKTDADYRAAIEYADAVQRTFYEREAEEIDRLQKDILAIVHSETPFDVFICYKETDESGRRTQDSVIANDIYHQLTQEGFKVFYAAITLEDKLGQAYEPYIFAALNSAKVMLVLGTKPEYFNAVWVRNEWSRYLKIVQNDRAKLLIPCYRDMDAYDLPDEFSHLQAQDMGKIGFINDIIRGIKKIISAEPEKQAVQQTVVQTAGSAKIENILKRGNLALEDGNWDEANRFFEQVLNENAEESRAYIGLLCAEMQVRNEADLYYLGDKLSASRNYKFAYRFADAEQKRTLEEYSTGFERRKKEAIETIRKYIVQHRSETAEDRQISVEKDLDAARQRLAEINETIPKIEAEIAGINVAETENLIARIQSTRDGVRTEYQAEEGKLEQLKQELKKTGFFQKAQKDQIRAAIAEQEKRTAPLRERFGFTERKITELQGKISHYSEQKKKIAQLTEVKERIEQISVPELEQKKAALKQEIQNSDLVLKKDFNLALDYIKRMGPDCLNQLGSLVNELPLPAKIRIGLKTVTFSNYEWHVIFVSEKTAVLLTKNVLFERQFHKTNNEQITWEQSDLRNWLNTNFYNLFTDSEKKLILKTLCSNHTNTPDGTQLQGNDTEDYVYILSREEAEAIVNSIPWRFYNESWWLRTTRMHNDMCEADIVPCTRGYVKAPFFQIQLTAREGVRPAITIKLD
ncbi:MAG: TIR domain-containing protein [Oscillospiraceae bacterium]|nr:TIR domain-containing protein [Oscillospiraceae bacterium]